MTDASSLLASLLSYEFLVWGGGEALSPADAAHFGHLAAPETLLTVLLDDLEEAAW